MNGLLPENFDEIVMNEFKKYDYNNNGTIEKKEMILLIRGISEELGIKAEEVENDPNFKKSLLLEIDTNEDKKVSYEEFKIFYGKLYLTKKSE